MKTKLLLAGAGLVAAGLANAQTNVTIYGIADVGVEFLTNAARVGTSNENVFRMASGNLSGSRFGFRGTEDLGGGMKAVFQLESGFDLDTGMLSQGGRLFGRHAFVGVQGGLGAITLGHQQNALYDLVIKYDPMGFSSRYSALTHDAAFAGRPDNTIKYTGAFGPLTATAFYSFGRNLDGEVPGSTKVSRNVGGGVAYASGPFGATFAYDQYQGNTVATAGQSARRMALAGSYAMGALKGFVGYRWLKDEIVAAGAPSVRSNLYWAGLAYDLSPALKLTGAVYHTDRRDSSADPTSLVLSADYSLSKRTDLYLTVAHARNKSGSNLGLNGFGSSIIAGENQTGIVAGVRHRF
ncbi:MAG TPA: porin [Noviherbaspirillum sp.]|jgi:predicted porin|uniref:porin n=1 Tax=Noviherbaspirillum sp. TaxID=1926288 RepID=UPI002F9597EF